MLFNDDTIFYHGSKGGIIGDISVKSPNESRTKSPADFGDAFYIGEYVDQAKGMCTDHPDPWLYDVRILFSKVPSNKILVLNDVQWLFTVLAFRSTDPKFKSTEFVKDVIACVNEYSLVVGPIADDKMFKAIFKFNRNEFTTEGLKECLQCIKYGNQIAVKDTSVIEIVNSRKIAESEIIEIRSNLEKIRLKAEEVITSVHQRHLRDGLYKSELEEKIINGEITVDRIFPDKFKLQWCRNNAPESLKDLPNNELLQLMDSAWKHRGTQLKVPI